MKTFCPNCENDTECEHTAELYECKECGEDFAQYIASRKPAESDVSITQDVSIDIKTPQPIENDNQDYYKGEVHEFHFTEALRNIAKSRPADVSAIGVSILIDHVEELEVENKSIRHILSLWKKTESMKEIDRLQARIAELEAENDRLQSGWFRDETICPDGSLRPKVSDLLNRIAELSQAVGLITTLKPTMVMDANHPLDMVREVAEHVTARIAELEAENNRLAELLHNELSSVEIATDLGNKRWTALNKIYEDGEKHNTNWCKRIAQEGLGIKNA